MTDYNLDALSPRMFEHLIQVLAHKEIAPTLIPFGDGPDGSREATFEGPTNYGSGSAKWVGYGIVQAKFRQRSSRTDDGKWAHTELRKELRRLQTHSGGRKKLDYYIFCSNVTLTAAERTGGKDQVLGLLQEFAQDVGLKGFDVWDYDKLRILLDEYRDIRDVYGAWITAGDVMADLAASLRDSRRDYYKIIISFLQRELLGDQFAKLEQGGHSADERIPLSQVFVDLPTSSRPATEALPPGPTTTGNVSNFTKLVVEASSESFVMEVESDLGDVSSAASLGRFVLIGGPGQGKTTLGQFICQLFRVSLLKDAEPRRIDREAHDAIARIVADARSDGLALPSVRRLPIRVVLSEFAAKLAAAETSGLVDYVARCVSHLTSIPITSEQMLSVMSRYPIILVLDGLDEVPSSTNRQQVLDAIRGFWVDAAADCMDVFVIATSRPQGYNEDFSRKYYAHRYLVPLDDKTSLKYGSRLTKVRYGSDSSRVRKVVGRLERAISNTSTSRLMRSPLQVTIMTLLVDRMGQPPQERWTLFREYYNLIYQREIERDIPAAAVLRDYRTDIDAIHKRVGLVLQIESERSGSTDARLTTETFGKIVNEYIVNEEGHRPAEAKELETKIIEASAHRLVFLVGLEEGLVGFEIRSLQEFMAAEGVMEAEDVTLQARLREIAPIANWRNVFLFAAGKCFSERRYLRDTIAQICHELNDAQDDPIARTILAGSSLALDLLEDGPAARQPMMNRLLTRLALRLLHSGDERTARRLLSVFQTSVADIYFEELTRCLDESDEPTTTALIGALGSKLEEMGGETFEPLARRFRELPPSDFVGQACAFIGTDQGGVRQKFFECVQELGPAKVLRYFSRYGEPTFTLLPSDPSWMQSAIEVIGLDRPVRDLRVPLLDSNGNRIGAGRINPIDNPRLASARSLADMPHPSAGWELVQKVIDFCRAPSIQALRMIRRSYDVNPESEQQLSLRLLVPWIFQITDEKNARSLPKGLLGGKLEEWRSAEASMLQTGLTVSAVSHDALCVVRAITLSPTAEAAETILGILRSTADEALKLQTAVALNGWLSRDHDISSARESLITEIYEQVSITFSTLGLSFFPTRSFLLLAKLPFAKEATRKAIMGMKFQLGDFPRPEISLAVLRIALDEWRTSRSEAIYPALAYCAQTCVEFPDKIDGLEEFRSDDPDLRSSVTILKIRTGFDVESLENEILDGIGQFPYYLNAVAAAISRLDPARSGRELLALCKVLDASGLPVRNVLNALSVLASNRRSRFNEVTMWRELKFPGPLEFIACNPPS